MILSVMRRSYMKALWFSLTILGRKRFSRLAMTLEVSLEITLQRLIGLY